MLKPIDQFQLSPRVTLKPGDRVKLTGSGGDLGYRLPGRWKVKRVLKRGKRRTYLEVTNYSQPNSTGGVYTVFVDGPAYRRHGVMFRPYKVKRLR